MKKIHYLIILPLLLCALIGGCLLKIKQFAAETLNLKQEYIFTLPSGTGREGLKNLMRQQQLTKHLFWLLALLHVEPELANFKAGTYRLLPGMTVREMLKLLVNGKEAQFSIRFIEGSTLQKCLEIVAKAPYMEHDLQDLTPQSLAIKLGASTNVSLEGFLYPDTYLYTANTTGSALLKRARQRMDKSLQSIWQQRAGGLPYKNPQDLLTMASMVEKETGIKQERAKIASVFINRLRLGMKLQTDPTVIYGIGETYRGSITRQDLTKPSPYNTYIISGLPPTPISMLSQDALEAAAHPEKTNYLYFVANGSGGHVFTTNLASHNKAVQQYRQRKKEKRNHEQ
ncbi:MAG: endolytic murein transglycosylase [Sodalis sp. Fle]|nr:MAG: endolytic murein transglycosylase [Sodalis sp. Fle]